MRYAIIEIWVKEFFSRWIVFMGDFVELIRLVRSEFLMRQIWTCGPACLYGWNGKFLSLKSNVDLSRVTVYLRYFVPATAQGQEKVCSQLREGEFLHAFQVVHVEK